MQILFLLGLPADSGIFAENTNVFLPIVKDPGHTLMVAPVYDQTQMKLRERTLRSWYLTSKGERSSRSQFFELLDSCTPEKFSKVVKADLERSACGGLRTLALISQSSRRDRPLYEELLSATPDEQTLQWLFLYRGYVQFEHEQVIERELPVSPAGVPREGWIDILAFDSIVNQPILVELKQGQANDSLTGVLLEVLAHWAFHMRYIAEFRRQLKDGGVVGAEEITMPSVVIAAPRHYFRETLRRASDSRRHNETRIAALLMKCMKDEWGLNIRLLAISDDWQEIGAAFNVEEWSVPVNSA